MPMIDPETGSAYFTAEEILEAPIVEVVRATLELIAQTESPGPGEDAEGKHSRETIRNTLKRLVAELTNDNCPCIKCTLRRWREAHNSPAALTIVLENLTDDHAGAVHLSVAGNPTAPAALKIMIKALAQVLADVEGKPLTASGARSLGKFPGKGELH